MNTSRYITQLVTVIIVIFFYASLQAGELRISVAASMTELFKDLAAMYEKSHPEVKIISNFGPSGGLAKQIDLGAPADLYVSANPKWMHFLIEEKKVESSTQKIFAHNTLVFTGLPQEKINSLADLPSLQRIGIGSPGSVPAGQYAKEAMVKKGLYDNLLKDGKLVMAKDVRQALIYADRGETDGSFVYKTDALLARQAKVFFEVPQELYHMVTYPLAMTVLGMSNSDAKGFYDFIVSAEVYPTIAKYGFSLPQ
ncbi:molybdate ABC transporter substrate-binding protein [Desulfopila sp. IMCC35008]|uniref:molybdate ABC transporter substrate-binding protein n=1 Tax=Desulfopila sp. IMCC35008 TaxID=2653858 RepID=UPI0013D4F13B|nr:molybdate ABC transporter substrate-binding protein [Desulfopila sp. IMCC35008]